MTGGLAISYGTLAAYAGRFLYPAGSAAAAWQFVGVVSEIEPGSAVPYTTPSGVKILVARQGTSGEASDFVALSSVCPHLGCKVHWQPVENRFFCPCHHGVFDPQGKATEGPPAASKQSLM